MLIKPQYDPVHIAEQQKGPRRQEQDLQGKQVAVHYTHAQYQQLAAKLCEAEEQLQIERARVAELNKAFDFQELNQKDLERHLSGAFQESQTLAQETKDLRDRLDGPRMSPQERAFDVSKIIIENMILRLDVARLKRFLTDRPIMDGEFTQLYVSLTLRIAQLEGALQGRQYAPGSAPDIGIIQAGI